MAKVECQIKKTALKVGRAWLYFNSSRTTRGCGIKSIACTYLATVYNTLLVTKNLVEEWV